MKAGRSTGRAVLLAAILVSPWAMDAPAAGRATPAAERTPETFFNDDRNTRIMLPPAETAGTAITPRPGEQLPLDAAFRDHRGRAVRLGDVFDGRRPVVLTFGYHRCPLLCPTIHRGLASGMRVLEEGGEWKPGGQYRVVSISIDPADTPETAARARADATAVLGGAGEVSDEAWTFLVPETDRDARRVAEAAGFNYRRVPNSTDFAHDAGAILITPTGVVSSYLFGVNFVQQATTMRWALIVASDGELGSVTDHLAMYCYTFSPAEGKFTRSAMRIMRLAGGGTVVVMAIVLAYLVARDVRRKRAAREEQNPKREPAPV